MTNIREDATEKKSQETPSHAGVCACLLDCSNCQSNNEQTEWGGEDEPSMKMPIHTSISMSQEASPRNQSPAHVSLAAQVDESQGLDQPVTNQSPASTVFFRRLGCFVARLTFEAVTEGSFFLPLSWSRSQLNCPPQLVPVRSALRQQA